MLLVFEKSTIQYLHIPITTVRIGKRSLYCVCVGWVSEECFTAFQLAEVSPPFPWPPGSCLGKKKKNDVITWPSRAT